MPPTAGSPKKMKGPPGAAGMPPKGMPSSKSPTPTATSPATTSPVPKGPPMGKKSPSPGPKSPSPPPGSKVGPKKAPPAPSSELASQPPGMGAAGGKSPAKGPPFAKGMPAGKSPNKSPVPPGKTPMGKKSPMSGKGMPGKKAPLSPGVAAVPSPSHQASGGVSRTQSTAVASPPTPTFSEGRRPSADVDDVSNLPPPSPREGEEDVPPSPIVVRSDSLAAPVSRTNSTAGKGGDGDPTSASAATTPTAAAARNPVEEALAASKQAQCKVLVAIDEMVIAGLDWRQHKLAFPVPMNIPLKYMLVRSVQAKFKIDDVLEYSVPVTVTGKDLATLSPNYNNVIQLSLTPTQLGWKPDSFNWVWLRTITNADRNDPDMRQKTAQEVYAERVRNFYEIYDESKCNTAEALVEDFEGVEDLLIVQLTARYGAEPTKALLEAKRAGRLPASVIRQHLAAGAKADVGVTPQSLVQSNSAAAASVFGGGVDHRHQGAPHQNNNRGESNNVRRDSKPFDDYDYKPVGGMTKNERLAAIQNLQQRMNLSAVISRSSETFLMLVYYRRWRLWRQGRLAQHKACVFLMGASSTSLRKEYYLRWRQAVSSKKYVRQVNAKAQQAEKSDSLISGLAQENSFLKTELKKLRAQLEVMDNTNSRRLETLVNSSELAVNQIKALTIESQEKETVIRKLEQKLMSVGNMMMQATEKKDFALKEAVRANEAFFLKIEELQAQLKDSEDAYNYTQHLLRQNEKKSAVRKKLLAQVGLSSRDLKLMSSEITGTEGAQQDLEMSFSGDERDFNKRLAQIGSIHHHEEEDPGSSARLVKQKGSKSKGYARGGEYNGAATDSEEENTFAGSDDAEADSRLQHLKRRKRLQKDYLGVDEALTVNVHDPDTGETYKKKLTRCRHCPHYAELQLTVDAHQRAATEMRTRMGDLEEALSRLQEMYNTAEEDNATLRRQLEERNAASNIAAQANTQQQAENRPPSLTRGNRSNSVAANLATTTDLSASTSRLSLPPAKETPLSQSKPYSTRVPSDAAHSMSGTQLQSSTSMGLRSNDIPASILKVIGTPSSATHSDPHAESSRPPRTERFQNPRPTGQSEWLAPVNPYTPVEEDNDPNDGGVHTSLRSFFETDCRISQERMKLQLSRKLASPRVSLLPRQRDALVKERELERERLLYSSMNGTTAVDSADAHARMVRDRERNDLEARYMLLSTGAGGRSTRTDYRQQAGPQTTLDAKLLEAAEKLRIDELGTHIGKRPTTGVGEQHNYTTINQGEGGTNPEVATRMKRALFGYR